MNREHIAAALAEQATPSGISVLAMDLTDPERIPPAVDWLTTIYNRAAEIAGEAPGSPVAASDGSESTVTPPEPENATWRAPVWWEHESQTGGRRATHNSINWSIGPTGLTPLPGGLVEYHTAELWTTEQARAEVLATRKD